VRLRVTVVARPDVVDEVLPGPARIRLERAAAEDGVTWLPDPADRNALLRALPDTDVLMTSWGQIPLTADVLDHAPRLRCVLHLAASVKHFATDALFERGILLSQAGLAMAPPVAEVALAFTLALLHRVNRFDHALRSGASWEVAQAVPDQNELGQSRIGVVGASRTGREYIRMVRALGARVLVHDPWLQAGEAEQLGVVLADLHEVMASCRVVALHAPSLPETHHLIGRSELAALPDGGGLVNTARSWLVDGAALLDELRTGRVDAALDVFDDEPLPLDSELRRLPNVLLTPHTAAATREGRVRLGQIAVEELERFSAGRPLAHALTRELLARMA